ncbi:hypothetical protein [Catellatospora citrea]|uniref:Uncharacterized protein n=1 Tax=Catellatospora citrea TaxID=53366 RepID=A0A8J3KJL6_9ACTN|nr:hypothetical protein [Catellatospora citrea]GIG02105.1 hypothetical protein Cci01nite_71980 [Catellatospora citrea]
MTLGFAESALLKVLGPLAKVLPGTAARLRHVAHGDHLAIQGTPLLGQDGSRFALTVALAPSRSAKPLPVAEFPDKALACAQVVLPHEAIECDYSGPELARFTVADQTPSPMYRHRHILSVHRTGLVVLIWGLDMAITLPQAVTLPLDEAAAVFDRMHTFARSPEFQGLHTRRLAEGIRRLDWRIGLSRAVSTNDGQVPWNGVRAPGRTPAARAVGQYPSCPGDGYAAAGLRSVKPSEPLPNVFRPVLEELLVSAGYTGVRECVTDVLDVSSRPHA